MLGSEFTARRTDLTPPSRKRLEISDIGTTRAGGASATPVPDCLRGAFAGTRGVPEERVVISESQTYEYLGHSPWSKLPCVEPSNAYPHAGGMRAGKGNPPGYPIWEAPNAPPPRSSSSNYAAIGT